MKIHILIALLCSFVHTAHALQTLPDDKVDTAPEVAAINSNFRLLHNGKLDLKPGNIIPRADSLYTLGASGTEWAQVYVDTVTAGQANVGGSSVGRLNVFAVALGTGAIFTDNANSSLAIAHAAAAVHVYGTAASNLHLGANANPSVLVISTNARVGVGTTNPLVTFHVSGGAQSDTLDTGQGANELYDMNQNVQTTDQPTFAGTLNNDLVVLRNGAGAEYVGYMGGASTGDFQIAANRNPKTGANEDATKRGGGINIDQTGEMLFFVASPGASGTTAVGFKVDGSTNVHIQPVGTANVELEVSDGLTTGGGDIHRATSGTHSKRALKHSINYYTTADYRAAYNDLLTLRHVTFKYKVVKSTVTMELIDNPKSKLRKGLIYEEAPERIKDPDGTIVVDDRIQMLEMALIEAIKEIETLKGKVK